MALLETDLWPHRPYYLGAGILADLPAQLAAPTGGGENYRADRLFLICDDHVFGLHGLRLLELLQHQPFNVTRLPCPRGEAAKTMPCLETLCEQLIQAGATKDSLLLALGGGATGNLVGMAAALLFRGIRYLQVPTTMMAQTDSVLSNKQAVNGTRGKNLFGVYYPPQFVWADTDLLKTEAPLHIRSALVESFKNAFISNPALLQEFDELWTRVQAGDPTALHEVVTRSIQSKIKILTRDPTERGYAMCLEYGHTFGHAIETLSRGTLTHGQAVAIGMMYAARLSQRLGYLDAAAVDLHRYYLQDRLGMSLHRPPEMPPEQILATIRHDNKRTSTGEKYVLLRTLGEPLNAAQDCLTPVPENLVQEILTQES